MSDMPAMAASGLPGKRVEAQRAGITIAAFIGPGSTDRQAGSGERRAASVTGPRLAPRILPGDLRLMRRLSLALGFLVLFVFAFSRLELLYGDKFFDVSNTGNGEWIWMPLRMADGTPAAFYATRDFDLPSSRQFTRIEKGHAGASGELFLQDQARRHSGQGWRSGDGGHSGGRDGLRLRCRSDGTPAAHGAAGGYFPRRPCALHHRAQRAVRRRGRRR